MAFAQIPMKHKDKELVPRFLVQAMFALMLGTLAIVALAQWARLPNVGVMELAPVETQRLVWLVGDRSGTHALADVNGAIIETVSPDRKTGFIGMVGIVVKRQRAIAGITEDAPIRIVRRTDGRVGIIDDATGMDMELTGYGPDNIAAFARLLD